MNTRIIAFSFLSVFMISGCGSDDPSAPPSQAQDEACDFEAGDSETWTSGEGTFSANPAFGQLSVSGSSSGDGNCTGRAHFRDRYRVIVPESQVLGDNRRAIATASVRYQMDGSGSDNTVPDGQVTIWPRYGSANGLPYQYSSSTTSGPQDQTADVELLVFLTKAERLDPAG